MGRKPICSTSVLQANDGMHDLLHLTVVLQVMGSLQGRKVRQMPCKSFACCEPGANVQALRSARGPGQGLGRRQKADLSVVLSTSWSSPVSF